MKDCLETVSDFLGYNLTVTHAEGKITDNTLNLTVKIKNTGLARFYYSWKLKILIFDGDQIIQTLNTTWDITTILPD